MSKYEVSQNFDMFTDEGNRRLRALAVQCWSAVRKSKDWQEESKAYVDFYYGRLALGDQEGFEEANDTAVREAVWCESQGMVKFHGRVWGNSPELEEAWELALLTHWQESVQKA